MSKPAVIRAEFTDYRPVKTRKVLQLVFEVPAEMQTEVFASLGYPIAGISIWCAIARLAEGASAPAVPESPEPAAPVVKAKLSRSMLAAILCEENEDFQVWLAKQHPLTWDEYYINGNMLSPAAATATLKNVLCIRSRKELDTDPEAAARFDALRTSFELRDMVRA